eukprot:Gb_03247 [translate_table: standard]
MVSEQRCLETVVEKMIAEDGLPRRGSISSKSVQSDICNLEVKTVPFTVTLLKKKEISFGVSSKGLERNEMNSCKYVLRYLEICTISSLFRMGRGEHLIIGFDKEEDLKIYSGSGDDDKVHKVDVGCKPKSKFEPVKQMIGYDFDGDENDVYRRKHSKKRKSKREETENITLEDYVISWTVIVEGYAMNNCVWRNHVPMVRRLLVVGVDLNAKDGESRWRSLHRAFHFGHLAMARVLIEASASLTLEDSRARTPMDLLSGPLQ